MVEKNNIMKGYKIKRYVTLYKVHCISHFILNRYPCSAFEIDTR